MPSHQVNWWREQKIQKKRRIINQQFSVYNERKEGIRGNSEKGMVTRNNKDGIVRKA